MKPSPMRRISNYLSGHWRGGNGLVATALFSVLGLTAVFIVVLRLAGPDGLTLALLAVAGVALLIWQVVGTLRAADIHIQSNSNQLPVWLAYGALLLAAVQSLVSFTALFIGTYTPPPYEAPQSDNVFLSGDTVVVAEDITFTTIATVTQVIETSPSVERISLDSKGGAIHAARGLATVIQNHQLDTEVTGRCFSACTVAFMAGNDRFMAPSGQLGFHQYRFDLPNYAGGPTVDSEQARDAEFFKAQGVAPEFLALLFQARNDEIWTPTRAELRDAGILTRDLKTE